MDYEIEIKRLTEEVDNLQKSLLTVPEIEKVLISQKIESINLLIESIIWNINSIEVMV